MLSADSGADGADPVCEAQKNTQAAETLANELKQALEQATADPSPVAVDEIVHSNGSCGICSTAQVQPLERSSSMCTQPALSHWPKPTESAEELQKRCNEMDDLRKRMLQQLDVEKEMRGCVEAVLSKERAHSRKLQQLLDDAQCEVRRLSSKGALTSSEADAIQSAHEDAVGRERADAAMAVREMKSISERALINQRSSWEAEKHKLTEQVRILKETREEDFEELQHQVAVLEGALTASRKEAEVAVARSRAQARVLLRKVKVSASASLQCDFLELTNERNLLENENKGLAARVSELEELRAQARKQLASERCQRTAAEQQAQDFAASKRSLEMICEEASSEICVLRNEVETFKNTVGREEKVCGMEEDMGPSDSHSRIEELTRKAQITQDHCRSIMVRLLTMLDPERVAPFAAKAVSCSVHEGSVQPGLLDAANFQALKMRLSSTAVFTETDTQNVLSRLDELLVFGLRALREAQDCEAAALRSSSEVQAQMTSSILSAQSVMQNQQYEIQLLKESNKQQHEELEVARHRLQQAAASAESLASTLAAQECEILRLQGASQKLVEKKSDRLNPSRMLRSQTSQTDALHAQTDEDSDISIRCKTASDTHPAGMLRSELTRCKAQLESRDCRIRELREALSVPAAAMDRHSLASKLTVTQEEFDSVQTHLMAAKEDASKSCDGCCHFKNYLAAICDQLRSVVTLAHSALQKVQEPGVLLQMPVHHKCEVNLAHMLADLSFVGGDSPQVDVAVKAAMDAIHALVAALESQHQRAVRLDVNFNRSLANSIKILSDTLSSLHSSLSEKSTGSDGIFISAGPSLVSAPEEVAALIPLAKAASEAATVLQVKHHDNTRRLAAMSKDIEHLNAELLEAQAENDDLQRGLRSQLQQFHEALESVKSETKAAQKTAQEISESELAEVKQACMLAQEMVVSRSQELKLCRGSLAASTKEVEDVKSELAIALQDRDTSLSSVSSLKTELHAANKKLQDLQSQLEKSRAATAHVKLSASHSCYKKTRHSSAVCDSRAGPTATCINAAKPLDVHVFVQQLEMSQKKLMKAVKEKSELESELKHLQARFERLQTVHTKACERRAGLDIQNKKFCSQVEALQAELRQASQSKLEHQEKLKQMADELRSMKRSVEQTVQDRKLWLSQLSSAEKIAQDSRSALVRVQDHCDEVSHTLASVQSQAETLKKEKALAETCLSEAFLELRTAQEALKACEEDLRLSRHNQVDGNQEEDQIVPSADSGRENTRSHYCSDDRAPLSQSTCINIASRYCEQRIADGEDAKCIRIQQLRETLISVASEKASLAEALSLCKENILQLEASASLPVRHMCQADKCTSPCTDTQQNLEHKKLAWSQTSPSPETQSSVHGECRQAKLQSTTTASNTSNPSGMQEGRHQPHKQCYHQDSTPCMQGSGLAAHHSMDQSDWFSSINRNVEGLNHVLRSNLEDLGNALQGQRNAGPIAVEPQYRNQTLQNFHCSVRSEHQDAACLVESLESTCHGLHEKLKTAEYQGAAEVQALQKQLCCAQQAEEVEREEKHSLQQLLKAASEEAEGLRGTLSRKSAKLLHEHSELAKLQRDRVEDQARLDALSKSLDETRLDAYNAVLRGASKESELQKAKSVLTLTEADLSAVTGRLEGIEASKSKLQDRFNAVSDECNALKTENDELKNSVHRLESKQKAFTSIEMQLRNELNAHQQKAHDLGEALLTKTTLLERKCVELDQHMSKMQFMKDRLEKSGLELQDARLQISNIQKDRAKAKEQSAADFKALVDARKQIVVLKKLIADCEAKARKHASRVKGNTLADVYKGGTMKRAHNDAMELAAARAIESLQADIKAQESNKSAQDAIYQEMEQKDLEILRLKQQVAEVTEELAASDSTVLYPSLAPALKGDTSVIKKMHIHPTLRRDASTDGSHLDSDAGRSNHMPHEVISHPIATSVRQQMQSVSILNAEDEPSKTGQRVCISSSGKFSEDANHSAQIHTP